MDYIKDMHIEERLLICVFRLNMNGRKLKDIEIVNKVRD